MSANAKAPGPVADVYDAMGERLDPPMWTRVHTIDEMEAFYHSILPKIREAARECGYAIGVHGSMRRDLDLIAAPWVADHADKDTLARAVQRAATGGIVNDSYQWGAHDPKPCGRIGAVFPICWTEWHGMTSAGHIDLAVMPDTTETDRRPNEQRDELFDALVKLADAVETRKPEHEGYLSRCAEEARAALAKARGES